MCGIVGYTCPQKNVSAAFRLFTRLMEESQVRGRHASGASWVSKGTLQTHREPLPASRLVQTATWKALETTPPTAILGHTRYSTSGDWHDNRNNQPLVAGGLAVAHNGLVSMATQPEFEAAYKVKTKTANDSEVLLRRVLAAKGDVAKGLERVYEVDPPIFACAFLDGAGKLTVVRDHIRPLWLFRVPKLNMTGFASTEDIIHRALGSLDYEYSVEEVEPYIVYGLTIKGATRLQALPFAIPSEARYRRPPVKNAMMAATTAPSKLEYDSPKHKQFDHRLHLRKSFKQYCVAAITSEEIDPAYSMMNYLFRRYELSKSQELWCCFLYGVFYHVGSVFLVLQEFPEMEKVDLGRLRKWHDKNWRQLCYNTDRKWEKSHLVEMVESYIEVIGGQTPTAQEEFYAPLLCGSPVENFHSVTRELRKLLRFGRYATYIYTEALARCVGLPLEADTIFLKESDSPRQGLAIALGKPEMGKGALTKEQWSWLEVEAMKLMREIQKEYPKLGMDHFYFESCLCSWKGFFRTTKGRYCGYYLDRMVHEIEQTRNTPVAAGVDWNVLYQFRREVIIPEYLGELADPPRQGVYRLWEHILRDTGRMVGLWPIVQRGLLKR